MIDLSKFICCTIVILFNAVFCTNSFAQNLFANPGFEDFNRCVEYDQECGIEAWFNIPPVVFEIKGRTVARPAFGKNQLWVNVENVKYPADRRAFVYTMFCCPLIKDQKYKLSFFLNTANTKFYHLDFYLSEKEPLSRGYNFMTITPTFSITAQDISGAFRQDWQIVEYEFTATGNERFCTLGNFSKQAMDFDNKDAMNAAGDVFYFLDDIKIIAESNAPLCTNYKENIQLMYNQDYRHSDNKTFYKEKDTVPDIKKPVFSNDTINIPSVLFDINSAVMKPGVQHIIDSFVNLISSKKLIKIDVNGHTDNTGTIVKNEQLALTRAESIKKYLLLKLPALSGRIVAISKGQKYPIADNQTVQGRAKNRRVEIIVTSATLSKQ